MDKKLNEVTKVTDMAYVPVIMADGSIGQIAKSDLASVVAEQMGNPIGYKHTVIKNADLDTTLTTGYYNLALDGFVVGGVQRSFYGTLIVYESNLYIIQSGYGANGTIHRRYNKTSKVFGEWYVFDNFGYNSFAELSAGVAGQIGVLSSSGVISINPGEEVKILPSHAFGLIILNSTNSGKTSIIASDSQYILDTSILYNGIGLSADLTATSKLCINRKTTNGEVYLKNNTSSVCNILARCVTA